MNPIGTRILFLIGGTVPTPAPGGFVRAVEEIEVVQGGTTTGRDAFRILLTVGRTGVGVVEYDLIDSGLLDPMNRLAAVVLVGAVPYGVIDGMILYRQFAPSNTPGQSKLVVMGEDISVMMDLEEVNDSYPNLPDGAIAAKVLLPYAKYGTVPQPTPTFDVETILTRLTTQTETDFAFLTRLARRNGFQFYTEPTPVPAVSKAVWGPETRVGLPQPALSMNFGPGTTAASMRFDLDALAPREVALPKSASSIGLGGLGGALAGLGLPLALNKVPASRKRMARDAAKLSATRAQSRLAAAQAASPDPLVVEGELDVDRYGQPLQPRALVGVRGVGPVHGGLYYVRQVVHRLQPRLGRYHQRFTLVREGTGATTPVVRP